MAAGSILRESMSHGSRLSPEVARSLLDPLDLVYRTRALNRLPLGAEERLRSFPSHS